MTYKKPAVFNGVKAMQRIDELEAEVKRLQEANANLEIRCRIAEEDRANMKNLINTQQDTINKYGEVFTLLNAKIAQGGGESDKR